MSNTAKPAITFISYFFPPLKAVGVLRNLFVSKLFADYHYRVTVYTCWNPFYLYRDRLNLRVSFPVKRSLALDYHIADRYLKRRKSKNVNIANQGKPSWLYFFPLNILIGEGGLIYILLTFFRLVFTLKRGQLVWSSYSPYSDHVIASLLKIFRPSIYWIADFRDVDLEPKWMQWRRARWQETINHFFFKRADLIVSVAEGYLRHVGKYANNEYLLRNGIAKLSKVDAKQVDRGKFTITYVGSLYQGRRNPAMVFEVLQDLIAQKAVARDDLALVYAGPEAALYRSIAEQHGLEDCIDDRGMVDWEESLRLQRSSQINFMISWSDQEVNTFPAKFYEYLDARRPILLSVLGKEDKEFESIREQIDFGCLAYSTSREEIHVFLRESYRLWKKHGIVPCGFDEGDITPFLWSTSFGEFEKFLTRQHGR